MPLTAGAVKAVIAPVAAFWNVRLSIFVPPVPVMVSAVWYVVAVPTGVVPPLKSTRPLTVILLPLISLIPVVSGLIDKYLR